MNSDKKMSVHFEARYRKFLLIFEESDIWGPDHEEIKKILSGIDIITYWCMSDEINEDGTRTHLFILLENRAVTESYIKGMFPGASVLGCTGSPCEYREFLIDSSFEECGSCPIERLPANFIVIYDILALFICWFFYSFDFFGIVWNQLIKDFLQLCFRVFIVFLIVDLIMMGVDIWRRIIFRKKK